MRNMSRSVIPGLARMEVFVAEGDASTNSTSGVVVDLISYLNRSRTSAFWKTWGAHAGLLDVAARNDSVIYPEGSDIWNLSVSWVNVTLRHPEGVISNVNSKKVAWADVGYMSMDVLFWGSVIAYPAAIVLLILFLSIFVSVLMARQNESDHSDGLGGVALTGQSSSEQFSQNRSMPVEGAAGGSDASLAKQLSPSARWLFSWWALLCRAFPALLVFGTPVALVALTHPYPQEVFVLLVVVSSVMVFSNGIYMVFFCPFTLLDMRRKMEMAPQPHEDREKVEEERHVVHWVVFPNYKEDFDVLCEAIGSVAQSTIARNQICILLAMEAREHGAAEKASRIRERFLDSFREVQATLHPSDLPNDPPGKASNMSWAFNWLRRHVRQEGEDLSRVVLTVSDADSNFHQCYFDSLAHSFVDTSLDKRFTTLWQSPIFHVKNYHRQPMPIIVGTMFTAMAEISVLADPNSVRFPYSTYSLSLGLAEHVGGWDPEWIAEDWHMGVKCFLLTLGESEVQPILLPTINYMPEDDSWLSTCWARWAQAKRHALGFSDMTYYFMMLPLVFTQLSRPRDDGKDLRDFWKLYFNGLAYVARLVNTHAVVGIMSLYMAISFFLKNVMIILLQNVRHVGELFDRSKGACTMFMGASIITLVVTTLSFQVVYCTLKDRMAQTKPFWQKIFDNRLLHWLYALVACILFAPFYAIFLGVAVWIAAVKVLCLKSFAYEVAAKPTADKHL
jgi:uncharacterized protein YhhL (DUF1145 family)